MSVSPFIKLNSCWDGRFWADVKDRRVNRRLWTEGRFAKDPNMKAEECIIAVSLWWISLYENLHQTNQRERDCFSVNI